jgi:hypothetical protein
MFSEARLQLSYALSEFLQVACCILELARIRQPHSNCRSHIFTLGNLDFKKDNGNSNTSHASFIHFSDEHVVGNLSVVGVSLGTKDNVISSSISHIKEMETGRLEGAVLRDMVSDIFDEEEKEELENEEVDKIILNSLCCEIMDDMMDLGIAYPQDCKNTPKHKPSSSGKKKRTRSNLKQNS